jgi:hypothetical protein
MAIVGGERVDIATAKRALVSSPLLTAARPLDLEVM